MVSPITLFGNTKRATQISTILVRHGFGELLSRIGLSNLRKSAKADEPDVKHRITFAERLRLTLQDLGPSFIKLGQIVSTRPDIIPEDVITELKKLQDAVPPITYEEVRDTIESTLGSPIDDVFTHFDTEPLASASIGQVHVARFEHEGEDVDVVVKVQRPHIRNTIERDIDLLYGFARLIERFIPESRIYNPSGLVREFDTTIMAELDFLREADNAERFARNFEPKPHIRFPRIYRDRTSRKVLTMERFHGDKITDAVAGGTSGEKVAKLALQAVAQMIYEDGFFHADPHPGNILILGTPKEPILGLLDLGLVGRISDRMRDGMIDLMLASIREDIDALTDALLALGKPRGTIDKEALRALVASLSEKYLGRPIQEIEVSGLIQDLVTGAVQFDIEMPTELLMVGKALMTIEGIGKEIYPELDVYAELRPYFLKLVWRRYNPQRLAREMLRTVSQLNRLASSLPDQLHSIFEDLRSGKLQIQSRDPGLIEASDRLGRRIFSGLIVASLCLSGALLSTLGSESRLATTLFVIAGTFLLIHVYRDMRRP